jgi:hypothetical protein
MKIKTTNNYEFIIDKEDLKNVSSNNWYFNKAIGYISSKRIYLHRFIMNAKKGEIVDHINKNKLDNRKENLRLCTIKENVRNCKLSKNNNSGFNGVSKHHTGKWRSYIMVDRKQIFLGLFEDIKDAIGARITAEIKYFGEFAPCI